MTEPAEMRYRLPTDITPTHYDLTVRTDLAEAKFDGIVVIQCVSNMADLVETSSE